VARTSVRIGRGSAKRIRRITWQDNTPPLVLVLLGVGVAIVAAILVWLVVAGPLIVD
jgi:hypothetical protein